MHTPTHHFYLKLLGSQLRLIELECIAASSRHLNYLILLVLLWINDTGAVNGFIVEGLVVFEFLGCVVPGKDNEDDAEEGPPEAHTETPDHTQHLIFKAVHHSR